jgi:hypothetical protein
MYSGVKLFLCCALAFFALSSIAYAASSRWWVCEYCGRRVHAVNMPGVQYCNKNPLGNTHKWLSAD